MTKPKGPAHQDGVNTVPEHKLPDKADPITDVVLEPGAGPAPTPDAMNYTLLAKDGVAEIDHVLARTAGEALMVFGKRTDINRRLELCDDPAEAEFYLRWLAPNPQANQFPLRIRNEQPVRSKQH